MERRVVLTYRRVDEARLCVLEATADDRMTPIAIWDNFEEMVVQTTGVVLEIERVEFA